MHSTQESNVARITLELDEVSNPAGETQGFLILAINAGAGNGWNFTPDVLRRSLALWDGVECFVDHLDRQNPSVSRSVRDLGGVCSAPRWDEHARGILLELTPIGPAADILCSTGRQMLNRTAATTPRLGFSADLILRPGGTNAAGNLKEVQEIIQILSVDLVHNPARGGAFIQALNVADQPHPLDERGGFSMNDEEVATASPVAEKTATVLCASLLDARLAASTLPAAACEGIRTQFTGRSFELAELDKAVGNHLRLSHQTPAP